MKKLLVFAAILSIVALASAPAFAFYVNVVECRVAGGGQNPLYTQSGPAVSSGKSTAAPLAGWTGGTLSGTGNYYAGDTTPVKWGEWAFTPTTTGYYNVYGTWVNVTAAQNMPPTWTVRSADADVTASPSQTSGGNAWNLLATGKKFIAGTTYKTKLATPGTNTAGKRASFDSVAWAASAPTAVTNTAPGNGATDIPLTGAGNDLTWTAGSFNSFFDVFCDVNPTPTTKVGADLAGTVTSFDPDSLPLLSSTTYYWKVVAKNVDRSADGAIWSFKTVPEPGSMLALGTGLIGLFGFIRRRRA